MITELSLCRPEQHGEETLSLISGVIGQSHDPLAVSMVIEGLVALCHAEVCECNHNDAKCFFLVVSLFIYMLYVCRWLTS